jgi:hypothetical protein
MFKWLDRLDPVRRLPKPMRRYLATPNRWFLAWLVVSSVALSAGLSGQTPSKTPVAADPPPQTLAPAPVAPAPMARAPVSPAVNIAVAGSQNFTLSSQDKGILITLQGQPTWLVREDADGLRVETEQANVVYRLRTKGDEQGRVYDAAGGLRFRLKCETEEGEEACKVYDGQAALLNRFKLKADSFNLYGADAQRLFKGKWKKGQYVVRNEADAVDLNVTGAASLKVAALLAVPVEVPVRVLLWRYAGF